jgi:quinol monooxygenase YgiN
MFNTDRVYELRRYRLRANKREALIELFEREFVETQIEAGMTLHGFYRDVNDPDAFVWSRSFSDMQCRANALASFYDGDVWKKWGSEANATMLNSDNVLLLKSAGLGSAFGGNYSHRGIVTISICSLAPGREMGFAAEWQNTVRPVLEAKGARIDASFVTERSPNSFPRLPVREGETVFVWVSTFPDEEHHSRYTEDLSVSHDWTALALPWLDAQLWRPLKSATLLPTRRSRHGW